jgi:vacuolar-type H+-ATPase subunit E/Vma4
MGGVVRDVEALKGAVLRKAQNEAESILDRVRRVSERDLAHAREEAEGIRAKHREKVLPMAEMEKRKAMAAVEMEDRRALLEKKEELVSRIFAEAESKLEEMRDSQAYVDIISKLIEECVTSIGDDSTIEFGKKDKDVFTEGLVSCIESQVTRALKIDLRLQFRCVGDDISAGVIVWSQDGRVVVDNSFSTRLRILKEELRGKVCEMLPEE